MCKEIIEVSPGTWELPQPPLTRNRGCPGDSNPRQQTQWYRQAKETKRGETGGGKS